MSRVDAQSPHVPSARLCVLVLVLAIFLPRLAAAADGSLYVEPSRASFTVGQEFDVRVRIDTDGASISAAEAQLSFEPRDLSVEGISTDGSILASWPTPPEFSNEAGTITFAGWTSTPYTGPDGLLVTVTFRALRTVSSNARLAAGAALSAQAGEDNIITSMRSAVFSIRPEEVMPEPEPELAYATSTTAVSVPSAPVLEAPVFIEYETDIEAGERIIVKGTARPSARVIVWLVYDGKQDRSDVLAAEDGSFTFVSDTGVEPGVYRMWAAEESNGMTGPESRQLHITVRDVTLSAAVSFSGDLLLSAAPYLALVIVAGFGGGYLMHRRRFNSSGHD